MTLAQTVWPRRAEHAPATLGRDALLMIAFSLLTAASAQVALTLPFTRVPITGQTFAVLLTGALLGPRLGALTMLLYLAEGCAGLPVFAQAHGGPVWLAGTDGGYLIAFPLAAAIVGLLAERGWDRRPATMLLAMLLGSALIFALGAAWLAHLIGLRPALFGGVLPFLPGDALKALLAAGLLPAGWKLLGAKRD